MKNTLFLSGLMALCCGAGMAATVAIDLNGEAAEGASLPANLKLSGFGDVNAVTGRENESRAASIFTPGGTALGKGAAAKGIDDFEVLAMLALTRS